MEFISKLNAKTNLVEGLATETVVVTSIETTSRTNKNGKAFGFVHGTNPQGELLTGIAYAATAAAHGSIAVGSKVLLESLAVDIQAGLNNRWSLSLPTAAPVSQDARAKAAAFLASLS